MKFPSVAGARGLQAAGSGLSNIGELIFNLAKNRADELRQERAMALDSERMGLQRQGMELDTKQFDQRVKEYEDAPAREMANNANRHGYDMELEGLRTSNDLKLEDRRSANDMARYQEGLLDDDLEGIYASYYAGKAPVGQTGAWQAMRQRAPNAPAGRLQGAIGRVDQRQRLDAQGPTRAPRAGASPAGAAPNFSGEGVTYKPPITQQRAAEQVQNYMKQFGISQDSAWARIRRKYDVK